MPTFSTLNHALQFGTNNPTVSIYGTDISGYIFYQMSGSFYSFEPGTKYFAIKIIFNTPYGTAPVSVTLTPANSFTQQALASTQAVGFYVDGGTSPGDVSSDLQTTYFDISGISTTNTILGAGVLAWYYEVSTGSLVAGGTYLWIIRQDSGGSKTITTYGNLFKFPGGTTPTLTTTGSAVDMISAVYDGIQLNCVFQADLR